MKKIMIKMFFMIIIGLSATLINSIGFWFLIPWTISWFFYDLTNK